MKSIARSHSVILGLVLTSASGAFVSACSSDSGGTPAPVVDGGTPDASDTSTPDGGDASTTPGSTDPIAAKAGEWTWVDFPNSACGNGEPTGIGVNLGTSKELFIYLEGGGACWDEASCYALKTASFMDKTFTEADLTAKVTDGAHEQFSRTNPDNAFKDMSYVFVPYCTGDVHSGDTTQTYGTHVTHHAGRTNLEAFLARIVPTFKDATRVVFGGSSAGGFGAAVNYWRAQEAFGDIRVDLVDDSGPPFDQKYIKRFDTWASAWNITAAFPPGCAECKTNVNAVFPYYAKTYPNSRFALLSYIKDPTITQFFGVNSDEFTTGLYELAKNQLDPLTNVKYFFVDDKAHTMIGHPQTKSGDKTVGQWLTEMVTDAPTWANIAPAQP